MVELPTIIVQLVWLAVPVFTLLISIRARELQPERGGNLMVAGSAILVLSALGSTVIQMGMLSELFGEESYGHYYEFLNLVSLVGQVLFLVGLYQFVVEVRSTVGEKDVLDHLPD